MSVVILGGNECMERRYQGALSDVPVPGQGVHQACRGALRNKLGNPDLMIFFTGTMSHKMVQGRPEPAEGPGHHHRALPHQLPVRSAGDPGKARRIGGHSYVGGDGGAPVRAHPGRDQNRQPVSLPLPVPPARCWRTSGGLNRVLVPRGLCLLPMRMDDGRALLYLYRPQALCRDLGDDLACRLLRQAGYPCGSCGRCVARLVQRLRTEEEFPHEVGLFLSYPPEDVQGFIDHRAMDFKCAGLWKVYGDQQRAQALFDRFQPLHPALLRPVADRPAAGAAGSGGLTKYSVVISRKEVQL